MIKEGGTHGGCFHVAQHGLSANISLTFQATLTLCAYKHDHCLAVLCKFLCDFWSFWEREIFFSKDIG